ncbi:hypothetical protein WN55_07015 [Dufourea novaeangliae]|uniref:Uncharacterized protein n=1 Tax=Dufourea novaeangliae TaxID=178035 RepID=A0A154PRQ3_DUFNO|nr:hypothetical protein WN55_07015 [Dufourea novaeangliae]
MKSRRDLDGSDRRTKQEINFPQKLDDRGEDDTSRFTDVGGMFALSGEINRTKLLARSFVFGKAGMRVRKM